MDLKGYFSLKPRGAKKKMAEMLGVSQTWLGLIIGGHRKPSPALARHIEQITGKKVKAKELRPDVFG